MRMGDAAISVSIVEDDATIRSLLQSLINHDDRFVCEYTFASADEALPELQESVPDVILMDFEMPGMDGITGVREIRKLHRDVVILMLTIHDEDDTLFGALCAGANGYLIKGSPSEMILNAIQDAHQGGAPMSPGIAARVVASFRTNAPTELSKREHEVLQLLCEGDSYKEVAEKLFISKHTVRRHIRGIYDKLEVSSRAEMVRKAQRRRLIE
ncbi:MAG: response regulator transcription factor [Saprospiraceae bacterium]|nr:response regulator transcription factor [Saprospiraceae bacterium]